MAEYVDGFVLPVPKKKLKAYKKMAQLAAKVWREYGALDYRECTEEDLRNQWGVSFQKLAKTKPNETVVFAWIVFKSRKDRDRVNAKVMKDPRLQCSAEQNQMPFDCKRMAYGGFTTLVHG